MLKTINSKFLSPIKNFFLFLLLAISSFTFGQNKLMDNWEEELSNTTGPDRIQLIIKLTEDIGSLNIETADSLVKEGLQLAEALSDSLSIYLLKNNLGKVYYGRSLFDEGIAQTQKSLNYFKREKLKLEEAKAHLGLASLYIRKREYQKADSLISEAESYFINTEYLIWKCKIPYNRGIIKFEKLEYDKALNYWVEALRLSKEIGDVEYTAKLTGNVALIKTLQGKYAQALEGQFQILEMDCSDLTKSNTYMNIAQLYIYLEDWKFAREWFNKALELQKKLGRKCDTANSLYGLGIVSQNLVDFEEAIKHYEECLEIQRVCNSPIYGTLLVLGNVYNELGQPQKANEYYDEQMKLSSARNNDDEIYFINYNKGFYAYKGKRYQEALIHTLKAYETAVEKERLPYLMDTNKLLADIYNTLGDEKKSTFHSKEHVIYEDSIIGLKKIREVGAVEQKHQTGSQKDSLNSANQNDVSSNKYLGFPNQLQILIGTGLFILLSILAFFFFKKNRKKETIPNQNNSLDQEKIDQYFEELITLIKQNREEQNASPAPANPTPVNNMTEFLKTKLTTPNDWVSFEYYFEKVHKDFFKNLKIAYPTITSNELNICALLKLNLKNKDIAQIMGIGHDSIRVAQNRLTKKLGLPEGEVLRDFVLKI